MGEKRKTKLKPGQVAGGVKGMMAPAKTSPEKPAPAPDAPWDPDGALTPADVSNILAFTNTISVAGEACDILGRLRSKLKKHAGHAAVFVPGDMAKLVGVDELQSAMAGEADAQFHAGIAESAGPEGQAVLD